MGAAIQVGSFPNGVAVGYGFVWVTTQGPVGLGQNQWGVVKVDPATNRVVDSLAVRGASDVAVGGGSVWVLSDNRKIGVIRRIDPDLRPRCGEYPGRSLAKQHRVLT